MQPYNCVDPYHTTASCISSWCLDESGRGLAMAASTGAGGPPGFSAVPPPARRTQGRTAPWARASTSPLPAPVDERCAPVRTSPPTPARTPLPTSTMHFCHPRIRVVHIRTRRDVGVARSGARTTTTTTGHTVDNVYPSAELIPGQLAQGAADSLRRDAVVEGQTSSGKSSGQDRVNHSQPPSRNSRRTRGPRSAWDAKGILGVQSASERSANGKSDAA